MKSEFSDIEKSLSKDLIFKSKCTQIGIMIFCSIVCAVYSKINPDNPLSLGMSAFLGIIAIISILINH